MKTLYVYLNLKTSYLIISDKALNNSIYHELYNVQGYNYELLNTLCKTFCGGIISGQQIKLKLQNKLEEFE